MKVPGNAKTESHLLGGVQVAVPIMFSENHVCSAAEAAALQFLFAKNIQNPLRKKIASDELPTADIQKKLDDAIAVYDFGAYVNRRRGGGARKAPIDKIFDELVTNAVKVALAKRGVNSPSRDELKAAKETVATQMGDHFREAAAKELAHRTAQATKELTQLDSLLGKTKAA